MVVTQHEYTDATLSSFLNVLWMSTAGMALLMLAIYAACRGQNGRVRPVIALLSVMPNVGFMGLPIIRAAYGDLGTLYMAAVIVAFNLALWTVGVALLDRGRFSLKGMFNPGFIAALAGTALFLMRVDLPDLVDAPLEALSAVNTPLAMLILGARMAEFSLKGLWDWKNALVAFLKLIGMPLALFGMARLFSLDPVAAGAMTLACAMPSAIMCQMVAEQYDRDALFAAQGVSITSLLCILTIPLIVTILGV
jgi:predicted permease